jgi:ribosomal-protein-alanine N-acetyltransferase
MTPETVWKTERIHARPPELSDTETMFEEYTRDPVVAHYTTWRPHQRPSETRAFIEHCQLGWRDRTYFEWTLWSNRDQTFLGMLRITPRGSKVSLGYCLAQRVWGQGLATEAARAAIDACWLQPQIYRVWAVCDVDNQRSARVLSRLGMLCEGVLRRWIIHPNVSAAPRDCLCYARVKLGA